MTKTSIQCHVPMHTAQSTFEVWGIDRVYFGSSARGRHRTQGAGSKIGSGAPQPICCLLLEEKYFQRAQHQNATAKLWRI